MKDSREEEVVEKFIVGLGVVFLVIALVEFISLFCGGC